METVISVLMGSAMERRAGLPLACTNPYIARVRSQGNLLQAETLVEESVNFFRAQHDNPNIAKALSILADIKQQQEDLTQAVAIYKMALLLDKKIDNKKHIGILLFGLSKVALKSKQLMQAAFLLGATESCLKPHLDMHASQRVSYQQIRAHLHDLPGELTFTVAWSNGHTTELEQILAIVEQADFLK
jgi:tetratricopeptide (TPR) repeat protein